jgi:hypothetical protein
MFRGQGIHDMRLWVDPAHPLNSSGLDRVNRLGEWGEGGIDLLRSGGVQSVFIQLTPAEAEDLERRLHESFEEQGPLPPDRSRGALGRGSRLARRVMQGAYLTGEASGVDQRINDCTRFWRNIVILGERLVELVGLDKHYGHGGGGKLLDELVRDAGDRVIGEFRARP